MHYKAVSGREVIKHTVHFENCEKLRMPGVRAPSGPMVEHGSENWASLRSRLTSYVFRGKQMTERKKRVPSMNIQILFFNIFLQTATNHSVMEELMSITGKNMKTHPFVSQGGIAADFFIFFCIISFSSFTYYASLNITRERKKMKGLMRMMGLCDSAFWWVKCSTNK